MDSPLAFQRQRSFPSVEVVICVENSCDVRLTSSPVHTTLSFVASVVVSRHIWVLFVYYNERIEVIPGVHAAIAVDEAAVFRFRNHLTIVPTMVG